MSTPNDGGPAFPRPASHSEEGGVHYGYVGMTLRDWFAGQALAGVLASYSNEQWVNDAETSAKEAYRRADAMLAERAKAVE
ncbi:MAG: hypothetical protein WC655_13580 [Candidatus Hydrogenedentales bacterium]